jgi:hypothetical protein
VHGATTNEIVSWLHFLSFGFEAGQSKSHAHEIVEYFKFFVEAEQKRAMASGSRLYETIPLAV